MCLGCGRQFTSSRQLSAHAAQCGENKSVKLTDSIYDKKKKRDSDKHSKKGKRPRVEEETIRDGFQHVRDDHWAEGDNVSAVV